MPRVSVVIPNYNHEKFLARRIQSVLDQTYTDFEVIFLDDASSDDSLGVFSKYANDPRVRTILNTENTGSPFRQWNKGFAEAQGEYIWIAESDDYNDVTFLEKLVPVLDNHSEVGLAYCRSVIVGHSGETSSTDRWFLGFRDCDRWNENYFNSGKNEVTNYLSQRNTILNASSVLLRKSVVERTGGANERMRLCGDWFFWVNVLLVSDIFYTAESLNFFRRAHAESQRQRTSSSGVEIREGLEIYTYIKSKVDVNPALNTSITQSHVKKWANCSVNAKLTKRENLEIRSQLHNTYNGGLGGYPYRFKLAFWENVGLALLKKVELFENVYYKLVRLYRGTTKPGK